jgi:hypothetical protein
MYGWVNEAEHPIPLPYRYDMQSFLQVEGNKIVLDGKPVLLKG